MPDYDLTAAEYEVLVEAGLALYWEDIGLAEEMRSLVPVQMKALHDVLVRTGHINSDPEFDTDDD